MLTSTGRPYMSQNSPVTIASDDLDVERSYLAMSNAFRDTSSLFSSAIVALQLFADPIVKGRVGRVNRRFNCLPEHAAETAAKRPDKNAIVASSLCFVRYDFGLGGENSKIRGVPHHQLIRLGGIDTGFADELLDRRGCHPLAQ